MVERGIYSYDDTYAYNYSYRYTGVWSDTVYYVSKYESYLMSSSSTYISGYGTYTRYYYSFHIVAGNHYTIGNYYHGNYYTKESETAYYRRYSTYNQYGSRPIQWSPLYKYTYTGSATGTGTRYGGTTGYNYYYKYLTA